MQAHRRSTGLGYASCLEVDYEDREGWISGDEYENEAECPVCEREFKLMCSMSIDYEAKTMESEDDGVLLG